MDKGQQNTTDSATEGTNRDGDAVVDSLAEVLALL